VFNSFMKETSYGLIEGGEASHRPEFLRPACRWRPATVVCDASRFTLRSVVMSGRFSSRVLNCVGAQFDFSHFSSRSVVMSSKVSSRVLFGVVAGLAVMACLVSTAQAASITIADWQFNDGALLVDSSGNGHGLLVGSGATVTQSGGNAEFNGSGGLRTATPLDLTPYRHIKVSYGMSGQVAPFDNEMMYEQNTTFNDHPGSIVNYLGSGAGSVAGMSWLKNGLENYNLVSYTAHQTGEYVVDYSLDNNLTAPTQVVTVYENGTLIGTNASTSLDEPMGFANSTFYIGARGATAIGFVGTMSYLKIEAITTPEPGAIVLLATGVISLLAYAWRKWK
jgi:hypothetical protein